MPSLVKMDIEGAEWLALNGAGKTLEREDASDFLIEFHPREIQALSGSTESCLQRLADCGFQRYRLSDAEVGSHAWFVVSKRVLHSARLVLDCLVGQPYLGIRGRPSLRESHFRWLRVLSSGA